MQTYLHTPPYHTGSLPTLRLSPLPISTGSQDATHSRFRCRNYRSSGQTARSPRIQIRCSGQGLPVDGGL